MQRIVPWALLAVALVTGGCGGGSPAEGRDLETGLRGSNWAEAHPQLFGVAGGLQRPADAGDYRPRHEAGAGERLGLADGLRARFVTRHLASPAAMLVLYPDDRSPSHLIACIEQPRSGVTPSGGSGINPGIQRVELRTGKVDTVLYGTDRCDGIRATPWGSILAVEETSDGRVYELTDPVGTTGHWIADRDAGDIRSAIDGAEPSDRVAKRGRLPVMAWEGLAVLPSGVIYAGDDLRPGEAGRNKAGGAIYKFLPANPRRDDTPITRLDESPLVAGSSFALTVSCWESSSEAFPQYGQGCEVGEGAWVQIDPAAARADAGARHATGNYRPGDLRLDPAYQGDGVRFCWANTGREEAGHYAEVMCAIDDTPVPREPTVRSAPPSGLGYLADRENYNLVRVTRLVEGDPRFNSFGSLAFQPRTGILYILEDHVFGEIIACLPDGADRDVKSDGCLGIGSVVDPKAEPNGLVFEASGETAYLILQHGEQSTDLLDFQTNPADGTTDDLIRIDGLDARF